MTPRDRLVWGLVGALAFLVLVQAYELLAGVRVGPVAEAAVALAVGAATVVLTPPVERRVDGNGRA